MSEASLVELRKYERDTEQCMKCGFCSFVCPVYQEEKIEAGVARGKNELIKRVLSGELELTRDLADSTEMCPAKAVIPRLVVAARADIASSIGMRFPYGLIYRRILSNRKVFGSILSAASVFQSLLMPKTNGMVQHMPDFLAGLTKGRLIPSVAKKYLRQLAPEATKPKTGKAPIMRVGYFTGCMNEFVTPQIGLKTIDFLARQGIEVVMPRTQGCCGAAIFLGGGDFATGRALADSNVKAFEGLDYIIADCATCACALTEYPHFLADSPQRTEAYARFAGKVRHSTQFLVDVLNLPSSAYRLSPELQGKKITWHDPCHLNRHLGAKQQPRQIIQSLEGANYIEMPNADRCCGMGGQFSLLNPELSMKIGDKKIESAASTEADIVVTACPGCQFQLADGIARLNKPQKVMNIMELLA
jgi:glycolate oxidase iron-sulfur subunit